MRHFCVMTISNLWANERKFTITWAGLIDGTEPSDIFNKALDNAIEKLRDTYKDISADGFSVDFYYHEIENQ
jgi:hypothetical protein